LLKLPGSPATWDDLDGILLKQFENPGCSIVKPIDMKRFNVLVGIITVSGDKLLLLQRSASEKFKPRAWGPPCGKIKFRERLENAVRRELLEETGLKVNKIRGLVGYSMFPSKQGDDELHNVQINFVVEVVSPEPVKLDNSSEAYKWIPISQCESIRLSRYARSTIRQGVEFLTTERTLAR
jgi:8-oxo-dGTP diphosphatase